MYGGDGLLCEEKIIKLSYKKLYTLNLFEEDKFSSINLAIEAFTSVCFIMVSHYSHFGAIKSSLAESMNVGRDEYPKTLQAAYELLLNTETLKKKKNALKKAYNRNIQLCTK